MSDADQTDVTRDVDPGTIPKDKDRWASFAKTYLASRSDDPDTRHEAIRSLRARLDDLAEDELE